MTTIRGLVERVIMDERASKGDPLKGENSERRFDLYEMVLHGTMDDLKEVFRNSPTLITRPNENGDYLAHLAAKHGRSDIIQWLSLMGTNFDEHFNAAGFLPIHEACLHNNLDCVLALKLGNANMSAPTESDNVTPFHMACRFGNLVAINLFMKSKADANALDLFGNRPIDLAVKSGHKKAVEFLADKMGIPAPTITNVSQDCVRQTETQKRAELRKLLQGLAENPIDK